MKKIILILTFIITVVGIVFASIEANDYFNKKKKIDDKTIVQEVEENIKEAERAIKEKQDEESKVKEEKKDKVEELEKWQKKIEDMAKNL